MKTPDKVYIRPQAFEPPWPPYIDENANYGGEEYIRKESLLEWANSWLAFKRSGLVLDDGFSYAMEELIKKLNEM